MTSLEADLTHSMLEVSSQKKVVSNDSSHAVQISWGSQVCRYTKVLGASDLSIVCLHRRISKKRQTNSLASAVTVVSVTSYKMVSISVYSSLTVCFKFRNDGQSTSL